MKRSSGLQNFIIYLLLTVFLITGSGMGLDEGCQVFSLCGRNRGSTLTSQTFTTSGDLHTFEVRESSAVVFSIRGFKSNRSESFGRSGLFFLCVLAVLSGIFRLVQEIFVFYDRLYVHDRFHMITFMHDTDGRKRIS